MVEPKPTYRPRCMHLCCKAMLVFGEAFESDAEYQAGVTDFWCLRTSQSIGPDGQAISLDLCSNAERSCFQEY